MFPGLEARPKPPGTSLFVLPFFIGGLALSNDGVSPNTVIDISAGVCASDDFAIYLRFPSAFTKNCNAAFGVGSANGALDSGSTLAASTWYHKWAIGRSDGSGADFLLSTSATSPTLPTGYTKKRRLGSLKTDSSAHILAFTQTGTGNKRKYLWAAALNDLASQTVNSGARTLFTLASVPPGIKVDAIVDLNATNSSITAGSITPPDTTSNPSANWQLYSLSAAFAAEYVIRTDTSQRIGLSSGANGTSVNVQTMGWQDDI